MAALSTTALPCSLQAVCQTVLGSPPAPTPFCPLAGGLEGVSPVDDPRLCTLTLPAHLTHPTHPPTHPHCHSCPL